MKRLVRGGIAAAAVVALGSAVALSQTGNESEPAGQKPAAAAPEARPSAAAPSSGSGRASPPPPASTTATPMNERVAVIGLLNKRNGIARDLTLKPGQSVRVNDVIVRLRACETTAPWETQKLTGAFVQTDVRSPDGRWRRVFSGWLFKESPSLNVVEHPVYDVWPKSCAMNWPEMGPDTVSASSPSPSRSSAKKSGDGEGEPEAEGPRPSTPSAESSNET